MVSCTGSRALRILSPASPSAASSSRVELRLVLVELVEPRPDRRLGGRRRRACAAAPRSWRSAAALGLEQQRARSGSAAPRPPRPSARAQRLERRLRALARSADARRCASIGRRRAASRNAASEQRADAEQDQPVRPMAGREEHEREHEQRRRRRRAGAAAARRRTSAARPAGTSRAPARSRRSGTSARTVAPRVEPARRTTGRSGRARAASAPQFGQGSALERMRSCRASARGSSARNASAARRRSGPTSAR